MSASPRVRERNLSDPSDLEPPAKRVKLEDTPVPSVLEPDLDSSVQPASAPAVSDPADHKNAIAPTDTEAENLLPPSHVLLGTTSTTTSKDGTMLRIMETDVGISEYISKNVPRIEGIIKQRRV